VTAIYCSVSEVRLITKVQTSEYSDSAITLMIENAQAKIEQITNTTFGVATTVTEYHEFDDQRNWFFTDKFPIASITSLSVNINDDGTYTTLDATTYDFWTYGLIKLNSDAVITCFPSFNKSTKIVYVYGSSTVPAIIKDLCLLLVTQQISDSPELVRQIDDLIDRVKDIHVTN
jgi:hypothetical protein